MEALMGSGMGMGMDAGKDGMYVSETSSAVLDVEKSLVVCCKAGSDDMIAGGVAGKSLLHHLIKQPTVLVGHLISFVFNIKTRQQALGGVVPFLTSAISEEKDETIANAYLGTVLCAVLGNDKDKSFAGLLILKNMCSRTMSATVYNVLVMSVRKVSELAEKGVVLRKGKTRPTKLGLAACCCVFDIVAKWQDAEECSALWNTITAVQGLVKQFGVWHEGYRPLVVTACTMLTSRLDELSSLRHHHIASNHNQSRLNLPVQPLTPINQAFLATLQHLSSFSTTFSPSALFQLVNENDLPSFDLVLKLTLIFGSGSDSDQSSFVGHHLNAGIIQGMSGVLIKLLTTGGDEIVPGDNKSVQNASCAILRLILTKEGGDVGCSTGQVVELLEKNCRGASVLAVAMAARSGRTIIPELLRVGNESSLAALREVLKVNPELKDDENMSKKIVETVISNEKTLEGADGLLCELPQALSVPSLLRIIHRSGNKKLRTAADSSLTSIAARCGDSSEFLHTVTNIVLTHQRAIGEAFSSKGGERDPLANPPPQNPADISTDTTSPRDTPIAKQALTYIKAWCDHVKNWENLIDDVWAIFFSNASEEFMVSAVCTIVGPVAAEKCNMTCFLKTVKHRLITPQISSGEEPQIFDKLAPFLILRPLRHVAEDAELVQIVVRFAKDEDQLAEIRRISWEFLSRVRPIDANINNLLDGGMENVNEFKLRVFFVCSAASRLVGEEMREKDKSDVECLLATVERMSNHLQSCSFATDEKAKLAILDAFSLTLAAAVRYGVKASLNVYSPKVLVSAIAYLRKAGVGVPKWFVSSLVEHCTTKLRTDEKVFSPVWLELLFNMVYSVSETELAPHVVSLSELSLKGIEQPVNDTSLAASLKLLASLFAKASDSLKNLPSWFLPTTAQALTRIASNPSPDPQISQLASQLLSMLVS